MAITQIIGWILFGFVVGTVARFVMPGRQRMGMLMTILLGIVGSFAGGALGTLIFGGSGGGEPGFVLQPSGWIMSIVGALIVLFIYSRMVTGK